MTQRGRTGWRRWLVRGAVCVGLGVLTTVGVAWAAALKPLLRAEDYRNSATIPGGVYDIDIVGSPGRCRRTAVVQAIGGIPGPVIADTSMPVLESIDASGGSVMTQADMRHANERWGRLSEIMSDNRPFGLPQGFEQACGWPYLALWCDFPINRTSGLREICGGIPLEASSGGVFSQLRALPYLPVWRGLLIDTAIYSILWCGLFGAVSTLWPGARMRRRQHCGHCPACGYDLVHKFDAGCPECGWNRA